MTDLGAGAFTVRTLVEPDSSQTTPLGNDLTTTSYSPPELSAPQALATGDFDGDGDLDVAVINGTSNDALLLTNDGTGNLVTGGTFPVGFSPSSLVVGEFDLSNTRPGLWIIELIGELF